jgi:hypothetical protein
MKNKIEDLRNHLFAQLERLGDDDAMKNPIAREREIARAKAISEVSKVIVESAKVEVQFIEATSSKNTTGFIPVNESKRIGA